MKLTNSSPRSNGKDASLLSLKSRFESLGEDHLNYMQYMNLTLPRKMSTQNYLDSALRMIWLHYTIQIDTWLHNVMENMSRS